MIVIKIGTRKVPVCSESMLSVGLITVVGSSLFQNWIKEIDPSFFIFKIEIQSVDMFGSRVGFIKLKALVWDKDNNLVPGICFLRGGTVVLLPILMCGEKEYTILTTQPRFPVGKAKFDELPAGMLDDFGSFAGAAAKEIKEETGIEFLESGLVDITPCTGPIFISPGASDERTRFFVAKMVCSQEYLDEFVGKCTGNPEENEHITLKVIPLDKLPEIPQDGKTIVAWALYQRYLQKKAGTLFQQVHNVLKK